MEVVVGKSHKGAPTTVPTFNPGWPEVRRLEWRAGYVTATSGFHIEIEPVIRDEYRVMVNGESAGVYDYVGACALIYNLVDVEDS